MMVLIDCFCLFLSLQVSVLVLKVQSVCVAMEALGESTAAALQVGQVTPNQMGNVSLRQYLSNRSLGKNKSAFPHTLIYAAS